MKRKKIVILITLSAFLLLILMPLFLFSEKGIINNSGNVDDQKIVRKMTSDYFPNQGPEKFTVFKYWDGYIGFFRYKKIGKNQPLMDKKLKLVEDFINIPEGNQKELKKLMLSSVGMENKSIPEWYLADLRQIQNFRFYRNKKKGLDLIYDEDNKCFYFFHCSND